MIYLIPAWYKKNSWNECDQCWYVRRTKSEYDDTVKQTQLFHRSSDWSSCLMVLSYMPNLRHFLHRQGLFKADYWSCFDSMMEIRKKKISVFSYKNVKWPKGIKFKYTSFAIIAMYKDIKYAQIEFGEDGNLIRIDMFEDGKVCRTNYYDDRGFVSGSIVYQDGKELYQDYLMENGIWKMRQYAEDGHVEINPKYNNYYLAYDNNEYCLPYSKMSYDCMADVVSEVVSEYVALTDDEDIFCVAAHKMHTDIFEHCLKDRKTIVSVFERRMDFNEENSLMLKHAKYIVADTYDNLHKIMESGYCKDVPIIDISPYDTRTDYGISQQVAINKILVPIDGLSDYEFESAVAILGGYIKENDRIEVHFFTRKTTDNLEENIINNARAVLSKYGVNEEYARKEEKIIRDNNIDEEEMVPIKFFVDQCIDELSVNRCIREQRLLVDLREVADIYVQIAAISAAIPQIVKVPTQYVVDGENGVVVDSTSQLLKALRFYLGNLANWNEAMICATEIGKKFSTKALLDKWKEVLKVVGSN